MSAMNRDQSNRMSSQKESTGAAAAGGTRSKAGKSSEASISDNNDKQGDSKVSAYGEVSSLDQSSKSRSRRGTEKSRPKPPNIEAPPTKGTDQYLNVNTAGLSATLKPGSDNMSRVSGSVSGILTNASPGKL